MHIFNSARTWFTKCLGGALVVLCLGVPQTAVWAQRMPEEAFMVCLGLAALTDTENPLATCLANYAEQTETLDRKRGQSRRGCRDLRKRIKEACRDLGDSRAVCRIGTRQFKRACRKAQRGATCKAQCLATKVDRVNQCGNGRNGRQCRRSERRALRRCRRACR